MTEDQIDAVVQDIQENFEGNLETCVKEIVKRAQDFKKKPRNHYQNPPPNHLYHCEICHGSLPDPSPSTVVIKYRCTDPEISFGDLKIGGLMRKTSIVLHTPQDNRRNSIRDSLRESRLSFLSGNGFEENNQLPFLSIHEERAVSPIPAVQFADGAPSSDQPGNPEYGHKKSWASPVLESQVSETGDVVRYTGVTHAPVLIKSKKRYANTPIDYTDPKDF